MAESIKRNISTYIAIAALLANVATFVFGAGGDHAGEAAKLQEISSQAADHEARIRELEKTRAALATLTSSIDSLQRDLSRVEKRLEQHFP